MDFEALYYDLLGIALEVGELDDEAVRKAEFLLELPRYAAATEPRQLLVQDLKKVIEEIPRGRLPGSNKDPDNDHHEFTRLFFSLDEPGTQLSDRRRVKGGATRWQTPAIIYRVLLGLLALDSEPVRQLGSSFSLDAVRIVGAGRVRLQSAVRTQITYRITVNEPRLHALWLPESGYVDLHAVDMERRPDVVAPQIIHSGKRSLLTFGAGLRPGEALAITVAHRRTDSEHEPPYFPYRHPLQRFLVSFYTTQPVGELAVGIENMPDEERCAGAWSAAGVEVPMRQTTRSLIEFGPLPAGVLAVFGSKKEFDLHRLLPEDQHSETAVENAVSHAHRTARGLPPLH